MKIVELDALMVKQYLDQLYELKYRSLRMSFKEGDCENLEQTCREKIMELPTYVEQGKAVVFGAMLSDELVGFLWAYPRTFFNQPRMFVNGISVRESVEGTGVARRLIEALIGYSKRNQFAGIDLTVAPFNEKAVGFYRHLNFEEERIQMFLPIERE